MNSQVSIELLLTLSRRQRERRNPGSDYCRSDFEEMLLIMHNEHRPLFQEASFFEIQCLEPQQLHLVNVQTSVTLSSVQLRRLDAGDTPVHMSASRAERYVSVSCDHSTYPKSQCVPQFVSAFLFHRNIVWKNSDWTIDEQNLDFFSILFGEDEKFDKWDGAEEKEMKETNKRKRDTWGLYPT